MSFGDDIRNGVPIGLPSILSLGLPPLVNPYPALNLDFINNPLDPRITFSRGSQATLFDSTGTLVYANNNLVVQSENFGTTWVTTNSSVSTNVTTAPDGTTTADKLTEALDVNSVHQVAQTSVTVMSSATYTASVYAKADTRTRVRIAFIVGGTGGVLADANLTSGTIGAASSFGGGTAVTSAIQSVGNGWFRILITGSGPAGTSGELRCELLDATGNRQYNGDGTSGLFLWGAMLNIGSTVGPYVQTVASAYYAPRFDYNPSTLAAQGLLIEEQRTNLTLYSEELDNAVWVKNVVTVSANVGVAPNGTTTADKVIPLIATTAFKELQQNFSSTLGVNYAFSCYVKDAGYQYIQLIGTAGQFGTFAINYDLQTGTETAFTAGTSTVVSRGITPAGNGWYRVSVVLTAIGTSAAARIGINVIPASNSVRSVSWASDGTSGILQWGAQLEVGAFATSYIPTTTTALTRNADVASMTGTNFSSWYNASEGTLYYEGMVQVNNDGIVYTGIGDTFDNTAYFVRAAPNQTWIVRSGASAQATIDVVFTPTANVPFKMVGTLKVNDFAFCVNGGTVATDVSGALPASAVRLGIGNSPWAASGGNARQQWIRSIRYYPVRLPNSTLQALTA